MFYSIGSNTCFWSTSRERIRGWWHFGGTTAMQEPAGDQRHADALWSRLYDPEAGPG